MLVLLATGHTTAQTADATTWPRRKVVQLARNHGWNHDPDTDTITTPPSNRPTATTLYR